MCGLADGLQIFGKMDNHVPPAGRDLIRKTLHEAGVTFSFYEPAWAQRKLSPLLSNGKCTDNVSFDRCFHPRRAEQRALRPCHRGNLLLHVDRAVWARAALGSRAAQWRGSRSGRCVLRNAAYFNIEVRR